ncbi:MAG: hypothetical protein A3F18_02990 [Legionellales bacterium RIFCSPHIGHO2_12_FULL_37_14]|nr:MAG: hypothetical protein A3F18_02990 [Legionellales bacterium RIFCSPHIGHO2_12_FULL_37_14]
MKDQNPHPLQPLNVANQFISFKNCLKENLAKITAAIKKPNPNWQNLIHVLEEAQNKVEKTWSYFAYIYAVQNTKELRKIYNKCLPLFIKYNTKLAHHTKLYQAVLATPTKNLSATKKHIIQHIIRDFELNGVNLKKGPKKQLANIAERLSVLQTKFEQNLIDAELAYTLHIDSPAKVKGIPQYALQAAAKKAKKLKLKGYVFGIDAPSYQAIITYAHDRKLRETIYKAYVTKASPYAFNAPKFDNSAILNEILSLRFKEANLLGFPNYAAYSLKVKMAQTTEKAEKFLQDLLKKVKPFAAKEAARLKQYAKKHWQIADLMPWDLAFISEKLKASLYAFDEEQLRTFFTESSVWHGILIILAKLYKVKLVPLENSPTWHKDVRVFKLTHKNTDLGMLYVDLFARPYKKSGAFMDSLQTKMKLKNGKIQLPIASLTCNFASREEGAEALLYHDDVVTLFHELGHCLHHLLTEVLEYSAAGTNGVEWDAIELPSQMFEHWCWQKEGLDLLTSSKLPENLLHNLLKSKTFNSGLHLLRQLEFALFDLEVHKVPPPHSPRVTEKHQKLYDPAYWVQDILNSIRKDTALFKVKSYNRFQNSFAHIFAGGYAAGYYSYLWAEVLSSDCFAKFEQKGLFDEQTGKEFLKEILARGGSRDMEKSVKAFLGREMSLAAFLRHHGLIEINNEHLAKLSEY